MPKVKIVGVEKLQKKLRKNVAMEDVKKVVRHNGAEMQAKARETLLLTQVTCVEV